MPSIPAFYTAHWYEYSTKYWINWPNEDNPYWSIPAAWHIRTLPTLFGISPKNSPKSIPNWFNTIEKGGISIPTKVILDDLKNSAE